MTLNIHIEEKLHQIAEALEGYTLDKKSNADIGVLSGGAGIALFHFYYGRLFKNEKSSDLGASIIEDIVGEINKGYSFHTFCGGIAGAAWVIDLLEEEEYIDLDADQLLEPLDAYLAQVTNSDRSLNFFDFLHGLLGMGMYFLKRFKNTKSVLLKNKYKAYLLEIITLVKDASIEEDGMMHWDTILVQSEKLVGCNLALSHGIPSIINFMSRLATYDDFRPYVEEDLHKTIKYILQTQNKEQNIASCFPNWVTKDKGGEPHSRLAWCYGDLGIALSLWKAGKSLSDAVIKEKAIGIFMHATHRKEDKDTLIRDAGICHGSFGVMHIFHFMYEETGIKEFKAAAEFWLEYSFTIGTHQDGYAGYMKWQGGDDAGWSNEYVLLDGIAGIGLTLISYLNKEQMSWNECLMMG